MQRRDDLYLADIVDAADSIRLLLARLQQPDRRSFVKVDPVRSAVFQKLSVIGEAAACVYRWIG